LGDGVLRRVEGEDDGIPYRCRDVGGAESKSSITNGDAMDSGRRG